MTSKYNNFATEQNPIEVDITKSGDISIPDSKKKLGKGAKSAKRSPGRVSPTGRGSPSSSALKGDMSQGGVDGAFNFSRLKN